MDYVTMNTKLGLAMVFVLAITLQGCALKNAAHLSADALSKSFATTVIGAYRSVSGTSSPEEIVSAASDQVSRLPLVQWDDSAGIPNLGALHQLMTSGLLDVRTQVQNRHSVVPSLAVAQASVESGVIRNKTLIYISADESDERPAVAFSAMFFSVEGMVYAPTGWSSTYELKEGGFCTGKGGGKMCYSMLADAKGQAFVREGNDPRILNRVVAFFDGDLLGIYKTNIENDARYQRFVIAYREKEANLSDCYEQASDSIEGGGVISRAIGIRSACGTNRMHFFPDAISASGWGDPNEILVKTSRLIDAIGAGNSWNKISNTFYGYFASHINTYSRTTLPALNRDAVRNAGHLEWRGAGVGMQVFSAFKARPIHRSMTLIAEQSLNTHQSADGEHLKNKTFVAIAPEYLPGSGRNLNFSGYSVYIDKMGVPFYSGGISGKFDARQGLLTLPRDGKLESLQLASDKAGSAYLRVNSGVNAGLVLRVVLLTSGDVFHLSRPIK